jgi:hypothetical protein
MSRVTTLFAVAAIALISAGIIAEYWFTNTGITWTSNRTTGYAFPLDVPCNALAALFCVFAVRYSIVYIPFSTTSAKWHFWLSTVGVVSFAIGFLCIPSLLSAPGGGSLTGYGNFVVGLFFAGVAVFLIAQIWFVISFVLGVFHIQHV